MRIRFATVSDEKGTISTYVFTRLVNASFVCALYIHKDEDTIVLAASRLACVNCVKQAVEKTGLDVQDATDMNLPEPIKQQKLIILTEENL